MLVTLPETNFNFSATFDLLFANAFNLEQTKNLLCGKYRQMHQRAITLDHSLLTNDNFYEVLLDLGQLVIEKYSDKTPAKSWTYSATQTGFLWVREGGGGCVL